MQMRNGLLVRGMLVAFLVGMLAGCSSGDPESGTQSDEDTVEETVFDPMTGTMDRAREVEELSGNRMDRLNEELEESGESRP